MAATNFTPIILYHSVTASAAPTAGNLNNGELAINITDGKLFYKDNGGVVQIIATKGTGVIGGSNNQVQYNSSGALAGSANFTFDGTTATINTLNLTTVLDETYGGTGLTSYTTGDVIYASGSNTLAKLAIGANTYILTSTGSVPQWSAPSAVSVSTATNLAGGTAGAVPYQSGVGATTFLSIGTSNQVLTSTGSAPQWVSGLSLTTLSTSGNTTLGDAAADNLTINATVTSNLIFTDNTYDIGANGATRPRTIYAGTSIFSPLVDTTNLEVTNIKALDGTAALSIAGSTGVVSVSANPILSGGTANGVAYLNGSKVLTTGSALSFDGAKLVNTSGVAGALIQSTDTGGAGSFLRMLGDASSGNLINWTTGTPLRFATSDSAFGSFSEQMRLTSGGQLNLGGNFTSTNNTLQVTGNAAIGYTTAAPTTGLIVAGNVGVGTDTVVEKLTVNGAVAVTGGITGHGANRTTLSQEGANGAYWQSYGANASTYGTFKIRQASSDFSLNRVAMEIDSSGNLGLGVTPSGWASTHKAIDIGANANISGSTSLNLWNNSFWNGSNTVYKNTDYATLYAQSNSGQHQWYTAPSGTAGNTISFTQAMTLHASGGLSVGNTTDPGVGSAIISGNITSSTGDITVGTSGKFLYSNYVAQNSGTSLYLRGATASGQIEFQTNTTTKATLDSSGNLGLGVTPRPWAGGYLGFQIRDAAFASYTSGFTWVGNNWYSDGSNKYIANGYGTLYEQTGGKHVFYNAGNNVSGAGAAMSLTQAMTLDASGNLLVGSTSYVYRVAASRASDGIVGYFRRDGATVNPALTISCNETGNTVGFGTDYAGATSPAMTFSTGGTERARITSGGYFKASNDGTYLNSTGAYHEFRSNGTALTLQVSNTNASPQGVYVEYSSAAPNGTGNPFFYCADNTALRAEIRSNGGLANYQANDVNLSDQRTKKDIVAAPSYWDKIKGIEIVHFKYKDQTHDDNNVGVIAQQVEQVAPEFVDQDGWGETPEDGVPLKSIYTSDMYHAAIKALQEAMARIEKLEAEVAALKGV